MPRFLLATSLLATLALPAFAAAGGAQNPPISGGGSVDQQDKRWLDYAAKDNQGEIQECLLAEKKAADLAVRAFARLMVDDHVQVESQLAAIVNGKPITLENGPGEKDAKIIAKLESLAGHEFDREFMKDQVKDHSGDLEKFGHEISATKDADIRQFAELTVPILKQHLALAEAVRQHLEQGASDQASGAGSPGAHASGTAQR